VVISKKEGITFGLEIKIRFMIHMHVRDLEHLQVHQVC